MLPPRSFYCLPEISARWSVAPFDLLGWSAEGLLALSIATAPVSTGQNETVSGIVDVEASHLFPLFRRDGMPTSSVTIRRLKPDGEEFRWITEPSEGITITAADIFVRRTEVARFEEQFGLFNGLRRADVNDRAIAGRRRGPPERYDWDRFHGALTRHIHDHGIPQTQLALVKEMMSWLEDQDIDHVPDQSTVTPKIKTVWTELHRA